MGQRPVPSSVTHCINGDLLHALIRLRYAHDPLVQDALDWQHPPGHHRRCNGRSSITQPPVMRVLWMVFLMGQAAGAAAALAAKRNVAPREPDVRGLQRVLHNEHRIPLGDRIRV